MGTLAGRTRTTALVAVGAVLLGLTVGCSSDDTSTTSTSSTSDTTAKGTTSTGAASTSSLAALTSCEPTIDEAAFTPADELHDLIEQLNSFGPRIPGSDAHEAAMDWLADEFAAVPGMTVTEETYPMTRWLPTTKQADGPGLDVGAAGALHLGQQEVPVAAAVPFSLPTDEAGQTGDLIVVTDAEQITAANAKGKVVVQDVAPVGIPYAVFPAIGHYQTPDVPTSGDYDRPYLRDTDSTLTAAGEAGAAGVVFLWEIPTDQLYGYWQPHTGTRYHVPAVVVGSDHAAEVRKAAEAKQAASVTVRAEWDDHTARNLIATLPGASRERIVVNSHTDGTTWVQENGTIGALALARYLARLPEDCRKRDVQFALTANHLGYTNDGTFPYGEQLDADYDEGTVAFVVAMEHLGSVEVLPDADGTLTPDGTTDLFAWVAPEESPALVQASVDAVKRRELTRTAVLKGTSAPAETLPPFCSQGGLGTNFNGLLIPSIGAISGPWTLWTNVLGDQAIDPAHLRRQVLALGDVVRSLDETPRDEIAGDYLDERAQRAAGAATCDIPHPPQVAPGG